VAFGWFSVVQFWVFVFLFIERKRERERGMGILDALHAFNEKCIEFLFCDWVIGFVFCCEFVDGLFY
jgi:hypothetical protein